MNSLSRIAMASALVLAAGTAAQATTLTFDDLIGQYGDGAGVASNMTNDGQTIIYTESGFLMTLHSQSYYGGAHIGDGTGTSQTFNWHDGGDNEYGSYVTLTRAGGGAFNLSSFDFFDDGGFDVSAIGYSSLSYGYGGGNVLANFLNVTSVTFYGGQDNQLDNINVAGVPEPASWAMMFAGFGAIGAVARRRQKAAVSLS